MTTALCLNCGRTKFGAICECSNCHTGSTGNIELDIAFSDHYYSAETLEQFGAVIQEIHSRCSDNEKSFWVFMHFVSKNYPEVLSIEIEPEAKKEFDELLSQGPLPEVVIQKSAIR